MSRNSINRILQATTIGAHTQAMDLAEAADRSARGAKGAREHRLADRRDLLRTLPLGSVLIARAWRLSPGLLGERATLASVVAALALPLVVWWIV